MELQPTTFYDLNKFSNSFYLVQMTLHKYFADNVLRGEADRVIYASEKYCFRQRLNLLSKAGSTSITELDLPFMSYYRKGNWVLDDRPAVQNATAAMFGFPEEAIGFQNLRWLDGKAQFSCVLLYSTDADAQLGYELLMWIKHPHPRQIVMNGLEYKGYNISVPLIMSIDDISFAPQTTEDNWLKSNRIIPISFGVTARSAVFSQIKQTAANTLFPDEEVPVLTKKVLLDFTSYRFKNAYYDAEHIALEVEGILDPDTTLALSVSVRETTQISVTIDWTYDLESYDLFDENVTISVNGLEKSAKLNDKTYTITGLSEESVYNITIWTRNNDTHKIVKAYTTATTTTNQAVILKGLKG